MALYPASLVRRVLRCDFYHREWVGEFGNGCESVYYWYVVRFLPPKMEKTQKRDIIGEVMGDVC
jgi:hypothetical protein